MHLRAAIIAILATLMLANPVAAQDNGMVAPDGTITLPDGETFHKRNLPAAFIVRNHDVEQLRECIAAGPDWPGGDRSQLCRSQLQGVRADLRVLREARRELRLERRALRQARQLR